MIYDQSKLSVKSPKEAKGGRRCAAAVWVSLVILLASQGTTGLAQERAPAAYPTVIDSAVRREVVEDLAQRLTDEYAHATIGKRMASVIRRRLASGAYDSIASANRFADALQADLRSVVVDKHLRVSFDSHPSPMMGPRPGRGPLPMMRPGRGPGPQPAPGHGPGGGPPMPPEMRGQNGGISKAEILDGNIGYLEVNVMLPSANKAIDAAFAFLHHTDALIIDLRGNGGGSPYTVAYYMSYLSKGKPYVVMRVHTRFGPVMETWTTDLGALAYGVTKPVYVLTSYRTFSGGEELAYDIQSFKRGITVGETTGGGANPGQEEPLGHGFAVFMPTGYGVSPATGGNWEGVGVKPNVPVPGDLALIAAQRLAVQHLQHASQDPLNRAALGALESRLAREEKEEAAASPNGHARLLHLTREESAFVGSYFPVGGSGSEPTRIVDRNGELVLVPTRHRPPSPLERLGDGFYHMAGLPADFTVTFIRSHGSGGIKLLMDEGGWPPPPMMVKQ
jgi:hypothetical protein